MCVIKWKCHTQTNSVNHALYGDALFLVKVWRDSLQKKKTDHRDQAFQGENPTTVLVAVIKGT